jgi:hypothetical protein
MGFMILTLLNTLMGFMILRLLIVTQLSRFLIFLLYRWQHVPVPLLDRLPWRSTSPLPIFHNDVNDVDWKKIVDWKILPRFIDQRQHESFGDPVKQVVSSCLATTGKITAKGELKLCEGVMTLDNTVLGMNPSAFRQSLTQLSMGVGGIRKLSIHKI